MLFSLFQRRWLMARAVSPGRASSPGRKGAKGRPNAIVGLSEDEIKSLAGTGHLPINEEELSAAFAFFDVEGRGKLTVNDLKLRLGAFYTNLPVRRPPALPPWASASPSTVASCLSADQGVQDPDQRTQLHQADAD